ncbi:DUF1365-domain-containing protein [Xylaria acuta]|nr:DUF1365-domain-containing protein [Xylaria acuta]
MMNNMITTAYQKVWILTQWPWSMVFIAMAAGLFAFQARGRHREDKRRSAIEVDHKISICRTQIIKTKISHHRLLPRAHGFVYSYLSVGIPVRSPGCSWLVSVDTRHWWERRCLDISARDHLHRTIHPGTLSEHLDCYLEQQGLRPIEFPHVYLVTSPSVLGYKFSPASFWYLYTEDLELRYVIAEVNNTFDERRIYLFASGETSTAFQQTHEKDFHVSPFNSRKGSYELLTTDPAKKKQFSVTVTLRSSSGRPKLIARWWSSATVIDPCSYPISLAIWFLASWSWMIFLTYPRILIQAFILSHVRQLRIWHRPEPDISAISRQATSSEILLARILSKYLRLLSEQALKSHILKLSYPEIIQTQLNSPEDGLSQHEHEHVAEDQIELRIHTPQFFRQMTTYRRLADFLSYTLVDSHEENHTASSNDPTNLIRLLREAELVEDQSPHSPLPHYLRPVHGMLWLLYKRMRCTQPAKGAYPNSGCPGKRSGGSNDILNVPQPPFLQDETNFLDEFVCKHCPLQLQIRFIVAVLTLQLRAKITNQIGGQ